jgi:uncharacterized metal-binding protein YceD (DUF177 family)
MPSRFDFTLPTNDDELLEGGVRGVTNNTNSNNSVSSKASSANGVPGPEETKLDLTELLHTVGMRYTHVFAIPGDALDDLHSVTPFSGRVLLNNSGAALLVRGSVKADLELECVRSLELFVEPTETEIEEQFLVETRNNARQQEFVAAVDENSIGAVISGTILDFGELIRQCLLLAIPLQPIAPHLRDAEFILASNDDDEDLPPETQRPFGKLAELLKEKEG